MQHLLSLLLEIDYYLLPLINIMSYVYEGCGLWSFNRYYTQTEAEQLVRAEDTYDCSLKCSLMTNEKFFSFFVSI